MKAVVKNGKLANGYERGKGVVAHGINDDDAYSGSQKPAFCGARPRGSWSSRTEYKVTCPKCLKKMKANGIEENQTGITQGTVDKAIESIGRKGIRGEMEVTVFE